MAFSYGFYNYSSSDASTDHKIYDAEAISRIFDGIIRDGVYAYVGEKYMVWGPTNSAQNTVVIGTGRAWFKGTWNYNDSRINFTAPNPPAANKRIDALIIDVNLSTRHNEIKWVQGSVAANPIKPTLTRAGTHYQYALAYVTRIANTPVILDNHIENAVGTSETPYVTGILEMVDTTQLLANFERAFNESQAARTTEFNTSQTQRTTTFNTSQTQRTTAFNQSETERANDFNSFMTSCDTQFFNLKENFNIQATNLLNEKEIEFNSFLFHKGEDFDQFMSTSEYDFMGFMSSAETDIASFLVGQTEEFEQFRADIDAQCKQLIETYGLISEGYAVGTQNGTAVESTSPYYHNNSKWYSEQASDSKLVTEAAATRAEEAATRAEDAKSNVYGAIGIPEFTVDFTTGKLMYTNQSQYTFTIDTTTGQLTYAP